MDARDAGRALDSMWKRREDKAQGGHTHGCIWCCRKPAQVCGCSKHHQTWACGRPDCAILAHLALHMAADLACEGRGHAHSHAAQAGAEDAVVAGHAQAHADKLQGVCEVKG